MICIFRVGGIDLDTDAIPNDVVLRPYRIDRLGVGRAKTNALHYEISNTEPKTSSDLVGAIEGFLSRNKKDIISIRKMSGIDDLVLDVGLFIEPEKVMQSLYFNRLLLQTISELGISLEFSIYGAGTPAD